MMPEFEDRPAIAEDGNTGLTPRKLVGICIASQVLAGLAFGQAALASLMVPWVLLRAFPALGIICWLIILAYAWLAGFVWNRQRWLPALSFLIFTLLTLPWPLSFILFYSHH